MSLRAAIGGRMTRRDLIVSLTTAAIVAAATLYGGPLAGKVAGKIVPALVEQAADRIAEHRAEQPPLEEPPVWTVRGRREAPPNTSPPAGPVKITADLGVPRAKRAPRHTLASTPIECDRRDALERTYSRALLDAQVFPVTRHEAGIPTRACSEREGDGPWVPVSCE